MERSEILIEELVYMNLKLISKENIKIIKDKENEKNF